ncbi:hypothetical protein KUTeg_021520 [Tegillarca granosa]|uniref:Uncharacterized protein n=1 Tax=Tegillarca granosa TaxID=220873 RepID=A0ABQ9E6E5_TEGGR|nr:hypothetical protein KUTeg_021520 [Tegillarca granosa]
MALLLTENMENMKDAGTTVFEAVKDHLKLAGDNQIWLVFGIVTLLLLAPWGADIWLQGNCLLMIVQGISVLVFPQWWGKQFVEGDGDSLQKYELCCMGAMAITQGLTYFLLQNSGDKTVKSSLLWAMTLEFAAVLPLDLNYYLNPGKDAYKLKQEMIAVDGHFAVLWVLVSAFYALSEQDWGGYTEVFSMKRNIHLRIDFMINLTNGLLAFVLPTMTCKFQVKQKLTTVHVYLARVMGIGFIQMGITSGRASNFLKEGDKKLLLFSHALCYINLLVIMVLFQLFTSTFTLYHALYGIPMVVINMSNALFGCDAQFCLEDVRSRARRFFKLKSE